MSSTYAKRKLWSNLANLGLDDNFAYESYYAYSVTYPGAMASTPGRYRIRITKMPASEFLRNFSEKTDFSIEEEDLSIVFTIQAFLEKWTNEGWLQCLDWMGEPETGLSEIEEELNDMFESFTTGISRFDDKVSSPFPFKPPRDRTSRRPPAPNPAPRDSKPKPTDDDDFDFV